MNLTSRAKVLSELTKCQLPVISLYPTPLHSGLCRNPSAYDMWDQRIYLEPHI
jgi:hypothetical protein